MRLPRLTLLAALLGLFLPAAATAGQAGPTPTRTASTAGTGGLTGEGSALAAPLIRVWSAGFTAGTRIPVLYAGAGSLSAYDEVDFAETELPPTAYSCGGCVAIPWTETGVAIAYNLPGVGRGLRLSARVLAEILRGRITSWRDPRIRRLNPGVSLPNLRIVPVLRSDPNGEIYALSGFLHAAAPGVWPQPATSSLSPPAARRSIVTAETGTAAAIRRTPGALGVLAAPALLSARLTAARVQNAAGQFVLPGLDNVEAAGTSPVDPPRAESAAYPVCTYLYAVVSTAPAQPAALVRWLTYTVTAGREAGLELDYAPIPGSVQRIDLTRIGALEGANG